MFNWRFFTKTQQKSVQSGYVGNEGRLFLLRTREPVPTSVRIFIALTVHIRFADFCDNALMLRHAAQYRTVVYGEATCCNCKGTGAAFDG